MIGSIISGLADIAGTIVSGVEGAKVRKQNAQAVADTNATNLQIARETNDANAALQREMNAANLQYAQTTRDLQWQRDDNAFQRQVADLKAAGLNPAMISGNGAANSTPLGYTAQAPTMRGATMQAPHYDAVWSQAVMNGARVGQSIMDLIRTEQEIDNSKALSQASVSNMKSEVAARDVQTLIDLAHLDYMREHGSNMPSTDPWIQRFDTLLSVMSGSDNPREVAKKIQQGVKERVFDLPGVGGLMKNGADSAKGVFNFLHDMRQESSGKKPRGSTADKFKKWLQGVSDDTMKTGKWKKPY